jgi:hypothetical protein
MPAACRPLARRLAPPRRPVRPDGFPWVPRSGRAVGRERDDWYVLRLVDLDTGRQFYVEQTAKFFPDVED